MQQEVATRRHALAAKSELSAQRTLLEVARLSYSDIRRVVQWDDQDNVPFVASDQLDDETAAAISEFSVKYDKHGSPTKTIKFHPKNPGVELSRPASRLVEKRRQDRTGDQ